MLIPVVVPRMEQRRYLPSLRVEARNIWALVTIAVKAGEGQIVYSRSAAMLARDYMINFKWK
jgi:hypothetical protein